MEGKGFDIRNLFNEPEFKIDTQKYIDRYKTLLNEVDEYIENLKMKIDNEKGFSVFVLMSELILVEYQREAIQQAMNSLKFYSL